MLGISIPLKGLLITLDIFVDSFIDLIVQEELLINVFPTEKEPLGKIMSKYIC